MYAHFYRCDHCGNIITFMRDTGVPVFCCGEPMKKLVPHTVDMGKEKHVPEVTVTGSRVHVQIGSEPHPMDSAHYIEWVVIQTSAGIQGRELFPGNAPEADFLVNPAECVKRVFIYCNLHSLWTNEA